MCVCLACAFGAFCFDVACFLVLALDLELRGLGGFSGGQNSHKPSRNHQTTHPNVKFHQQNLGFA